jgi:hypothetical protein
MTQSWSSNDSSRRPPGLIARRVEAAYRMLMAHRGYVRSLPKGTKAPRVSISPMHR